MKLSKQELIEGHYFIAQRDLTGLLRWSRSLQIVTLDLSRLEQRFATEFSKPTLDQAFRLFRGYFYKVDREEEYRLWRFGLIQWAIYSMAFGIGMFWMLLKAAG